MINTVEERQARDELRDVLENTTYLLRSIEYAIMSTKNGDDRHYFAKIYEEVVKARKHLRTAEQIIDESIAYWIQYLGIDLSAEDDE